MPPPRTAFAIVAAGLLLLAGLAGCATEYALHEPTGPLDFGYRGGEGRKVRVATPFADERSGKPCPSAGSTPPPGWKEKSPRTARDRLQCSADPPRWLAEKLATALEAAGYTVVGETRVAGEEVLEIQGTLRTLDVEAISLMQTVLFEADVGIHLRLVSPSGLEATRSFYVKAARSKLAGGQGTLQEVLDEAATRALRDMSAATLSLTNRFPAVGAAPRAAEPAP
jgi:hypothetical protein